VKLHIVVPGEIVGKNEAKGLNRKHGTFFIPKPMKLWMRRVGVAANEAALAAGWPDPFAVKEASYKVFRYNVGGDYDRGNTYAQDALQYTRWSTPRGMLKLPGPIGIVGNDKDLWSDGSPPTKFDAGGPRYVIDVVLLAVRAPHEADELRRRWYKNEARRALRRKAKLDSKEFNVGKKVTESAAARRSRDELAQIERDRGLSLF
jgi:hypothetical protein